MKYPLTDRQKSLYLAGTLYGQRVNNIGGYLVFDNDLSITRFNQTRQILFAANDAFRLTLLEAHSPQLAPYQGALPDIQFIDFTEETSAEAAAKQWMQQDFVGAFELGGNLLFKDALLKVGPKRYFYYTKVHHVLMDGWGYALWGQRFIKHYEQGDVDADYPSFVDYLVEQEQYDNSQKYQKDKDYWLTQFSKLPQPLLDNQQREGLATSSSSRQSLYLQQPFYRQLNDFAKRHKTSTTVLFMAAIYVYFSRFYRRDDIAIGTPVHNRKGASLKNMIGMVMNVNVTRIGVDSEQSLLTLINAIKTTTKRNYRHQNFPINALNRELALLRKGRAQLFDLSFNYQKLDLNMTLAEKPVGSHYLNNPFEQTPLSFTLCEYSETQPVAFHLDFLGEYFAEYQAQSLLYSVEFLLKQFISGPAQSLSQYQLLNDNLIERLYEIGRGPELKTRCKPIVQRLDELALLETPALVCDKHNWCYRELVGKVNLVANALSHAGVEAGHRVGLGLNSGVEYLVSMLAVMKLKATFVPLMPNLPKERIAYMVENAQVGWVIAQSEVPVTGFDVHCRLYKSLDVHLYRGQKPLTEFEQTTPAYILHTSGTTGKPKGVAISEDNLMNLLAGMQQRLGLGADSRWLAITTPGFDISILEYLYGIISGGTLVLPSQGKTEQMHHLIELIESQNINVMQATPAIWTLLLEHGWQGKKDLTALCGGEALPKHLAHKLLPKVKRLVNCYGPTETTIWSMACDVRLQDAQAVAPIAGPLANTRHYVLDEEGHLLPQGQIGQLYIAGSGVGLGYVNLEAQTAEVFTNNPFDRSSKLYNTGDKVRYRADGRLEFLGRSDDQLKINGFRIEVAEIEGALQSIDFIKQAAVIAQAPSHAIERKTLVGFINVCEQSLTNELISTIEAKLSEQLPHYMVPKRWQQVAQLPLNNNGKVDRKALAAQFPLTTDSAEQGEKAQANNANEQLLLELWRGIFSGQDIGIDDNFFALGGHSLDAIRLTGQIGQQTGKSVTVRDVFDNPSIRQLALCLGNQSAQALPPLPVDEPQQRVKAAFAQQSLWFVEQMNQSAGLYNVSAVLQLSQALEMPRLERAVNQLIEQYDALSQNFLVEGSEVWQQPNKHKNLSVKVTHLDMPYQGSAGSEIKTLLDEHAQQHFDLRNDLLVDVQLLSFSDGQQILQFTAHHIVVDGISMAVLVNRLNQLYQDGSSPLGDVAGYQAYCRWQRDWLTGEKVQQLQHFWINKLKNAPPLLNLPLDKARPGQPDHSGNLYRETLSEQQHAKLIEFARARNTTPFNVLYGLFTILLSRYSGEQDIVIGMPVANRHHAQTEKAVGMFVNTLALRQQLQSEQSFEQHLQSAKSVLDEALAHQHLPFELLVDGLKVSRDISYHPVFQVMLSMQDEQGFISEFAGNACEASAYPTGRSKFDLSLNIAAGSGEMQFEWEYSENLFVLETIKGLMANMVTLLENALSEPAANIATIALLSESEQNRLIHWNDNRTAAPEFRSLAELFERQTELTPDNIAASFMDAQVSYLELNQRANQMARVLTTQGVTSDDLVALYSTRDIDMLVALLAIIKTGAGYVPVDPKYPKARVRQMLQDSGARLVLTRSELISDELDGFNVLAIDDVALDGLATDNLPAPASGHGLAYILYTSGSTGRPKGVMLSQQNVLYLTVWAKRFFDKSVSEKVLFSTSVCFDLSVFEMWLPWSSGGSVVVVDNILALVENQHQLSLVNTVPSAAKQLLEAGYRFDGVTQLNLAGEPLSPNLVESLFEHTELTQINNLYGPTEDTVYSTFKAIEREGDRAVNIGKTIANSCAYVVDEQGNQVPAGVVGELLLSGQGVGKGYWQQPELSEKVFINNPFVEIDGYQRAYKTGDLVRWSQAGELEYIGRRDHQVKLRGFRIELSEIKHHLLRANQVKDGVVVIRGEGEQAILVAYVVLNEQPQNAIALLKAYLKQYLTPYMLPNRYVVMDELPLTLNGKVDIKSLPAPEAQTQLNNIELTEQQTRLRQIWQKLLPGLDFGKDSDFFESGGHSLMVVSMVSAIRSEFGKELTLAEVFANSTLSELADVIEASNTTALPAIEAVESSASVVASPSQKRFWLLNQLSGQQSQGKASYNMFGAFKLLGQFDVEAFKRAVAVLIERQQILSTRFEDVDGIYQSVVPQTQVPVSVEFVAFDGVNQKLNQYARQSFDLQNDPLFQIKVLKCNDHCHYVQVVMHHIIADGWSLDILQRELGALYNAEINQLEATLAPLPLQYRDYANWFDGLVEDGLLQSEFDYWQKQLKDLPQSHQLPLDFTRPPVQKFNGATSKVTIKKALAIQLNALARRQNVTLFMLLQTAFASLMHRFSHEEDIVMATTVAGRINEQLESMVGCFVNTLVLRTDVKPEQTFEALLADNKATILAAFDHQRLPFDTLVEQLQVARNLSYNPLFQILFVLQNQQNSGLSLDGIEVSPVEVELPASKFDLEIHVEPAGDELELHCHYCTDLFLPESISGMLDSFIVLLGGIVEKPTATVEHLPILPQSHLQKINRFNDNHLELADVVCVHQMFEQQVAINPDAIALEDIDGQMTYDELNRLGNQLARYLVDNGIGAGDRVGLCMPRNNYLVVAMLAIYKTGAAYIPIDPDYPHDRVEWMIKDGQTKLLLTTTGTLDAELEKEATAVHVEKLLASGALSDYPDSNFPLPEAVSLESISHLIYTSGSTGKPKGVMIKQLGVMTLMAWTHKTFTLKERSRMLFSTSVCFDISVYEIWAALTSGGCAVVVKNILELLERPEINPSLVNTVPSAGRELLLAGYEFANQTQLNLAGEPLNQTLVEAIFAATDLEVINNLYGPSEDTTYTTFAAITRARQHVAPTVGKALYNKQLHVWDKHDREIPIGVIGELFITGPGVGQGYWQRDDLTEQRFIKGKNGEPMYRTGDLVRWLHNGELDFIGRVDHQVKLRGFRIELGEIDHQILSHPTVSDAVCHIKSVNDQDILVAYIVLEQGVAKDQALSQIKAQLATKLAHFMMPGAFVLMDILPLTANKKIDRKVLPLPDMNAQQSQNTFRAPQSVLEKSLAEIWQKLLGVEQVGLDDNFFELGGQSLLALRMVNEVKKHKAVELAASSVFNHNTVAKLAEHIESLQATDSIQLASVPDEIAVKATPSQLGLWYVAQTSKVEGHYHIPLVVDIEGELRLDALIHALGQLHQYQSALQSGFALINNDVVLDESSRGLDLEVLDLRDIEHSQSKLRSAQQAFFAKPFDLSTDTLWRSKILQLSQNQSQLLINLHHIIADGVSLNVMAQDIKRFYSDYIRGNAQEVLPVSPSYRDYAHWLSEYMASEQGQSRLNAFCQNFTDAPEVHQLPLDKERPVAGHHKASDVSLRIDQSKVEQLQVIANSMNTTLFALLQSSYLLLIHKLSNADDVMIGVPVANRSHAELEQLMGYFVNTLPQRSRLGQNSTLAEFIEATSNSWQQTFDHQQLPLESVINHLQLSARAEHAPLVQLLFNLLPVQSNEVTLPGVTLTAREYGQSVALFDMALIAEQSDQGISFNWRYDNDLFEADTVERFAILYLQLLDELLANAQLSVEDYLFEATAAAKAMQAKAEISNETDVVSTQALSKKQVCELVEIVKPILAIDEVKADEDLFTLGFDSIKALLLSFELNSHFDLSIQPPEILKHASVNGLSGLVAAHLYGGEDEGEGNAQLPVLLKKGNESNNHLFAILPPGSSHEIYHQVAQSLPDEVSLYAVVAPHAEGNVVELAKQYIEQIQTVQYDGDYQLCGWSAGGLLGFEIAQQLKAQGAGVSQLMLFDSFPQSSLPYFADEHQQFSAFALDIAAQLYRPDVESRDVLKQRLDTWLLSAEQLDDETKREQFTDLLKTHSLLPEDVGSEWLFERENAFKQNAQRFANYQQTSFDGPVQLFKAKDNPLWSDQAINEWQALCGELTVNDVDGDHYSMLLALNLGQWLSDTEVSPT